MILDYLSVRAVKLIAFILCLFVLLITGLYWLAIIIVVVTTICYLTFSSKFVKSNPLVSGCFKVFTVILLAILTRSLVFEIYAIPSESMENSLLVGDNVIVSKLNYGPKLPESPYEITWINLFFPRQERNESGVYRWPYQRLMGFTSVKRNDIIVFKSVQGDGENIVKRCLGLPGDQLVIKESKVLIGSRTIESNPNEKHFFRGWFKSHEIMNQVLNKLCIDTIEAQFNNAVMSLTYPDKEKLSLSPGVDSIKQVVFDQKVFPRNSAFEWTSTNWGPYLIPFKGMSVTMDKKNFILYKSIIENFEQGVITFRDQKYYLNGKGIAKYTFKQNYYFMLGDNRDASNDSRYWGVLPESHIMGKAIMVLYSNKTSFKWDRIMNIL